MRDLECSAKRNLEAQSTPNPLIRIARTDWRRRQSGKACEELVSASRSVDVRMYEARAALNVNVVCQVVRVESMLRTATRMSFRY